MISPEQVYAWSTQLTWPGAPPRPRRRGHAPAHEGVRACTCVRPIDLVRDDRARARPRPRPPVR
eukprot:COSAG03_NODE_2135_length_3087_cov_343.792169_3_plen_63_part_01